MLTVTADDLAGRISAALHREFGDRACAVQRIARAMHPPADPRAVRNWYQGINAPRSAELLNLGLVSAEVRRELAAILEAQARNEANALQLKRQQDALSSLARAGVAGAARVGLEGPACADHRDRRSAVAPRFDAGCPDLAGGDDR